MYHKLEDQEFEIENVHKFYEESAGKFSETRYKRWPSVERFTKKFYNTNVLFLDSGCGNGKNMEVNMYGLDYSSSLLNIAKQRLETKEINDILRKNNEEDCLKDITVYNEFYKPNFSNLIRGTAIDHPFVNETFDFILSIAVLHHFITKKRRILVLKDLFRILKVNGKILLTVWSDHVNHKKKFTSLRDNPNFEQNDFFVGWNNEKEIQRYYYLYNPEELEKDCLLVGFKIEEIKIEQESICAILSKSLN